MPEEDPQDSPYPIPNPQEYPGATTLKPLSSNPALGRRNPETPSAQTLIFSQDSGQP